MITIRPFLPADDVQVEQITWANRHGFTGTAELGNTHFGDSRLFYELFVAGYAAFEPELGVVAVNEADQRLVGYLLGTANEQRYARWSTWHHMPKIVWRLLHLSLRRNTRRAVHTVLQLSKMARATNATPRISYEQYPASLHINLLPTAQGKGVGTQLINTFETQLRTRGVPGIQLSTTNYLPGALPFYHARGFQEVHRAKLPHPFLPSFVVYDMVKALA